MIPLTNATCENTADILRSWGLGFLNHSSRVQCERHTPAKSSHLIFSKLSPNSSLSSSSVFSLLRLSWSTCFAALITSNLSATFLTSRARLHFSQESLLQLCLWFSDLQWKDFKSICSFFYQKNSLAFLTRITTAVMPLVQRSPVERFQLPTIYSLSYLRADFTTYFSQLFFLQKFSILHPFTQIAWLSGL